MRAGWTSWLKCIAIAGSCSVFLTSSCARQPIQSLDEPVAEITVEGAFADWSPTANPFSGGFFALLDAYSNELFVSEISTSNQFKIEKVPSQGKYYGLLIGPDYQVRGKLRKSSTDQKLNYNIFRTGVSQGQLGTMVMDGKIIASSQQADLDFLTNVGVTKSDVTKNIFTKEFSTNFVFNPDIDEDGIPNAIDDDVDGDDRLNSIDHKTYNNEKSPADSRIQSIYSYAYSIPKLGFFSCSQYKKSTTTTGGPFETDFWCTLKLPPNSAEHIVVKSYLINENMFDDGGTSGKTSDNDSIANDGLWSVKFSRDQGYPLQQHQLILADVMFKDGSQNKYMTSIGPQFPLTLRFSDPNKPAVYDKSAQTLSSTLAVDGWNEKLEKDQFNIELFIYELNASENKEIFLQKISKDLSQIAKAEDNSGYSFTFAISGEDLVSLKLDTNKSYKFKARLIAPAPLPGVVGSGAESALTIPLNFPNL